jgi:hypothetical protein
LARERRQLNYSYFTHPFTIRALLGGRQLVQLGDARLQVFVLDVAFVAINCTFHSFDDGLEKEFAFEALNIK